MKLLKFQKKQLPHLIPDLSKPSHEQLKYLRSIKPMICTPIRGAQVCGNYHLSMVSLARWAAIHGVKLDTQMLFGCTYIEQGRNVLANTFWNSDCTHLFFVDADNGFITNHFFELLLCQKGIIAGLYCKRIIDWEAVRRAVLDGVPTELLPHCTGNFPMHALEGHPITIGQEPQKVLTMPTGFMCIERKTLKTYVEAFPDRKTTPGNPGDYGIQFFRAGTIELKDENGALTRGFDSEDNIFCKDMLTLGVNTWLAPWFSLTHHGEYTFEACLPCSQGAYLHWPEWLAKQSQATK